VTKDKREKIGNFLLPNAPTFVVTCDSAAARIFLTQSRFGDWIEIEVLTNPAAATRERDRVTDRPGRVFDSFGKGRHAMAPEETGRQHEMHRFAHKVGNYLNRGLTAGDFKYLVLIADPTFLGYLRQELSPATRRAVCYEVPMNATGYDARKLKALFFVGTTRIWRTK